MQTNMKYNIRRFLLFSKSIYKNKTKHFLCSRIAGGYLSAQRNRLLNLEKEGKLEEYLEKEPNFMYSLLTDPRMTESKVKGIVTSLFLAGIDSVSVTT